MKICEINCIILHFIFVLQNLLQNYKSFPMRKIIYSQGECTVTESPIFFKLCEIKVSLCSKKVTEAYDPLFRNTREICDNTWEKYLKYVMYFI